MNNRLRLTDWLLLLAVPAFFFFWKLSSFGLIGADEPRYAQVAREMLDRHDWVTPTLGETAWLEKPPLYYWQAMFVYRLFGVSDWAARLPSALDAFLLVLAAYWFLRRFRPGFELDGGLMLATAAGMVGYARAASTDLPLAATLGIAMLAWYAWFEGGSLRYLAAFYVFLGLATLAKGPVAPFLAVVTIAIFAMLQRSSQIAWRTLWVPGIVLFCVVSFPWYILAQVRNSQFFRVFILEHNLARFGTNLYHHPEPFWYYVPVTFLGWVPWSIFVTAALVWRVRRFRHPQASTFGSFLLVWIFVVVVFFSVSQSKLPGYVLPAIPAGTILAAEFIREAPRKRMRLIIAGLHAALAGALMFSALLVQYLVIRHRVFWTAAAVPLLLAIAMAVVIFALLIKSDLRALRMATLVPAVIALAIALRFGSPALDETLSARPVANALASFDSHHLPVAVFLVPRETEYGLTFYRNQTIARYELGQIPASEHLLVAAQGFEKSIIKATGRKVVHLGNFAPQKLEYFYVPAS